MAVEKYLNFAKNILEGYVPSQKEYEDIIHMPGHLVFDLLPGADRIRAVHFGREIHLCTICNAKSGRCSEDCAFCSQSSFAKSNIPVYPLLKKERLLEDALIAQKSAINRFSIVTSGKRLSKKEVKAVAEAFEEMEGDKLGYCASLGTLDRDDFDLLAKAGMTRYHHNLETSQSYFNRICTTHSYQERIETINAARDAGLSLCVGGLFGMGESEEQILELALTLRDLDVDSVPINFLTPIKGTILESYHVLTPLHCLKIIAMFRYVLPDKDIVICAGREANLRELHPLIFYAGASGIMTGNYLTTKGRTFTQDLQMLKNLQFSVRNKIAGQSAES